MSENSSSLILWNCFFYNVENYLLKEEGNATLAKIMNCTIYLSSNFSNNEFLIAQSPFSEFSFSQCTVYTTKFQSFENFFKILTTSFTLKLTNLITNFRQMKCFIYLKKITAANLNLSYLEITQNYDGVFIKVESNSESSRFLENISILVEKSKFKVKNNYDPFFDLKGSCNLTIAEVTFLINKDQKQTIIKAASSKPLKFTTFQMRDTILLHLEDKKLKYFEIPFNNQSPVFSFIKSFSNIMLKMVSVMLDKKNMNAIMHISGATSFKIEKSKFIGNHLNEISHFILLQLEENIEIQIYDSNFQRNRVYFGAFLSLEIKFREEITLDHSNINISLKNNTILSNFANQGGFFYVNTSLWDPRSNTMTYIREVLRNINFTSNNIRKTSAEIGSYIFWEGIAKNSFKDEHSPAAFSKNKLPYQRFYVYTSIEKVSVAMALNMNFDSSNFLQIREKIVQKKKNIRNFFFCLAFYDRNKKVLFSHSESGFNSELHEKGSFVKAMSFLSNQLKILFSFHKGFYCAYRMEFKNYYNYFFGKKIIITINIENFQYESKMLKYLSKDLNKPVDIFFEVDDCKAGEFFEESTQVCRPCDRNTISERADLTSQIDCETCAFSESYYCYGGNLKSPKRKFWRLNSSSKSFLRCPLKSCLGDLDFEKNFTHRDCFNCFIPDSSKEILVYEYYENTTAVGYCSYGYSGSLCAECVPGFGSESGRKCADCSNKTIYLKQASLLLLKLILFFYLNLKAATNKPSVNNPKETEELISKIQSSYMIKIIIRHINYIAVLQTLPLELNKNLLDSLGLFDDVSPGESFDRFSSECFLNDAGVALSPVYAKLIFSLVFFTLALIIIVLLSAVLIKSSKKGLIEKLKFYAGGIFIIFFMDNTVVILNSFQPVIFCTNIGDENFRDLRILSALSVKCYDKRHIYYMVFLSLPLFLITIIIVPIILLFKILKAKKEQRLNSPSTLQEIGYFIFPYKETFPFFELVTFSNKLILVGLKPLFITLTIQNQEKTSLLIMFIYLVFFYIVQKCSSPYKSGNYSILQKLEVHSFVVSIANTVAALIWILDDNKVGGIAFSILLAIFVIILNSGLVIFWLRHYFVFFREKFNILLEAIKRITNIFESYFSKEKKVISKKILNRSDSLLMIELRDEIYNLNLKNNVLVERIKLLEKIIAQKKQNEERSLEVPSGIASKGASLPVAQKLGSQDLEIDQSQDFDDVLFVINPSLSEREMDQPPDQIKNQNSVHHELDRDFPKLKIISKELRGRCFYNMHLLIKYKVSNNNLNEFDFNNPESFNKDWSIYSNYDSESEILVVCLMRISKWISPVHEDLISLYFKSSRELAERKTINLKITLELSNFMKIEDIYCDSNSSTLTTEKLADIHCIQFLPAYIQKLKAILFGKNAGSLKIVCPLFIAETQILSFRIIGDDTVALSNPSESPIKEEDLIKILILFLDNTHVTV